MKILQTKSYLKNYTNQLLKDSRKEKYNHPLWTFNEFNEGFCFLLCVIYIYSKYAWVICLKDKKGITITNAFKKI